MAVSLLIAVTSVTILLSESEDRTNTNEQWSLGGLMDPEYFDDLGYIAISTEDQFNLIGKDAAYPLDGSYYMTNDIVITKSSALKGVGTETAPFTGVFDGNGYTISKADVTVMGGSTVDKMSRSLFSWVGGNAEISNLGSVENSFTIFAVSNNTYTGGIVGHIAAGADVKITNCYYGGNNTYSFSASGVVSSAGGIVGFSLGKVTLIDCYSRITYGSIDARGVNAYSGGLIGYAADDVTIKNCYNRSYLHSATTSLSIIGGLVGYMPTGTLIISNSYNGGNMYIPAPEGTNAPKDIAGGIVGWKPEGVTKIDQCYNTGNINVLASSTPVAAGGIMGAAATETTHVGTHTITNCYNTGNIKSTSTGNNSHSGGILGYSVNPVTIANCYSVGNISSFGASEVDSFAGGIVGTAAGTLIYNCYYLDGSVNKNGTLVNKLGYLTGPTVDGNASGDPRPGDKGTGVKSSEEIAADLTDARKGNAIFFIGATGSVLGWDFENIWTIVDGVNKGYPVFGKSPTLDEEETTTGGGGEEEEPEHVCPGGDHVCPGCDHTVLGSSGIGGNGFSILWALIAAISALSALILLAMLFRRESSFEIGEIGIVKHTGSQVTPEPWVKYNGKVLTAEEDFTYSYGENKEAGVGTVTITLGNTNKKVTVTFLIGDKN